MNALKGGSWASPFAGINTTIGNINVIVKDEDVDKALEIINFLFVTKEIESKEIEKAENITETVIDSIPKIRHGFTTFWLVFTLVIKILFFIAYISFLILYFSYINNYLISYFQNWGINNFSILLGLYIILLTLGTIGIIFLFKWKKIGYWMYFTECIVSSSILFILDDQIYFSLPFGFNIGIIILMFGILHIKKNGISTWEQLK